MKVLFKHLQNFTTLELDFNQTIRDLENLGIEVEGFTYYDFDKIIVTKIIKIEKHPDADKLQIATVETGKEELKIVCGATNIAVGQFVPLAQIGATLGDIVITKAKIRGIESHGMLCSAAELGLNSDHSGIYIFEESFEVGEKISKYLDNPSVLDLSITPNRPDWLSAYGIARELKAKQKLNEYVNETTANQSFDTDKLYFAYNITRISNVDNLETPSSIISDLLLLGIKPKQNIFIDITNWATIVFGQPLHSFDAKFVTGEISVRKASQDEKLKLINENVIDLDQNDTVIADSEKALALAGIMGGHGSAINQDSKDIYIEAASFIPNLIRESVVRHKLISDASTRFEKGVDPYLSQIVINEVVNILKSTNPNIKVDQIQKNINQNRISIDFDFQSIEKILGIKISEIDAKTILNQLGYVFSDNKLIVPSWRFDISFNEDIVEDILRFSNVNEFPKQYLSEQTSKLDNNNIFIFKLSLKSYLIKQGFLETQNLSFVSNKDIEAINLNSSECLKVVNPISSETEFLRPNLLIGLLKSIKQNPVFKSHLLFELGTIFKNDLSTQEVLGLIVSSDNNHLLKKLDIFKTEPKYTIINSEILNKFKVKLNNLIYVEIPINELKVEDLIILKQLKKKEYTDFIQLPPSIKDISIWVNNDTDIDKLIKNIRSIDPVVFLVDIFDKYTDPKNNKAAIGLRILIQPQLRSFTSDEIDGIFNKITDYLIKNNFEIR